MTKRFLFLAIAALAALFLLAAAPNGTKADPIEGTGFIWGPNGDWLKMREPLNHGAVFKALAMAIDVDGISQRLLGEPGMLMFVEDASPEAVVAGGSDSFMPEQSRQLLAEDGIASLTFTITGDPAVPPTMQIAEAIASNLKANIGANVAVVDQSKGHADYIVRKATQPPPPADLPFEYTCTPNTFRPNFWVPVECVFRITNNGSSAVDNVDLFMGAFYGDTGPYEFAISRTINSQPVSLDDVPLAYGQTVQPGETLEVRDVVLMLFDGVGEGKAEYEVNASGRRIAAGVLPYEVRPDAPNPPQGLDVSRQMTENANGRLTYRTTITNRGSRTINSLRLTEHYIGDAAFASSSQPSSEEPDVGLAAWDLTALGKESLNPGESIFLDTWYSGRQIASNCSYAQSAVVVEATVDDITQRYGARAEDNPVVVRPCVLDEPLTGDSGVGGGRGGGGGGSGRVPASPAAAGEGVPSGDDGFGWLTTSLAGGAIVLILAGGVIRFGAVRRMP